METIRNYGISKKSNMAAVTLERNTRLQMANIQYYIVSYYNGGYQEVGG